MPTSISFIPSQFRANVSVLAAFPRRLRMTASASEIDEMLPQYRRMAAFNKASTGPDGAHNRELTPTDSAVNLDTTAIVLLLIHSLEQPYRLLLSSQGCHFVSIVVGIARRGLALSFSTIEHEIRIVKLV